MAGSASSRDNVAEQTDGISGSFLRDTSGARGLHGLGHGYITAESRARDGCTHLATRGKCLEISCFLLQAAEGPI